MKTKGKFVNAKSGKPTKHIIEIRRAGYGSMWYWRIKSRNGKVVQHGENYEVPVEGILLRHRDKRYKLNPVALKKAFGISKNIARAEALTFGKTYGIPVFIQDDKYLSKYKRLY